MLFRSQSNAPLRAQIVNKIIEEIQQGRFIIGQALPGTRELAIKLNVNRKTVMLAYEELIAQGWLVSENKRGTFVSATITSLNHSAKPIKKLDFAFKNKTVIEPNASKNKIAETNVIHFSNGLADSRLIPLATFSRAMRHALISTIRTNKPAYSEPKGVLALREAITQMLNMGRGLHADVENICILSGRQMGFFLVGRVLVRPNDVIVVEKLSDQLATHAFTDCGATIVTVPQNAQGIDLTALENLCKTTVIRAVYVSPHYQIPTTVTMPSTHRNGLLALANEYDFLIIEDDRDFEFNFKSKPIQPIASLNKPNRVIYVGSLSNVLAPNFRIGFIVASREIIKQFANQILMIGLQGNTMTELAVAELLQTGEINKHTLKIAKIYAERRSYVCTLIREELSHYVSFNMPEGGLALWLTVNAKINMQRLIKDAESERVIFDIGSNYCSTFEQVSAIRLGFANLNNDELKLGIKRLKTAFQRQTSVKLLR